MRQISWKSNTGNNNVINIGLNLLKSTDPALPGGGSVDFELWAAVQGVSVGAVGGKIRVANEWKNIICTSVSSDIEAEVVVGNNTVVFNFSGTEGYFSGDVEVQDVIIYENWAADNSALTPTSNPLTIEISHSDNVFTSLHLSSGYMRFVGGYQDAEQFAASQPLEHPVKFYVNNELEWQGYIKCETLQQNWYNSPVGINIPVVSPLGLLSGLYPSNDIAGMGLKSVGQFLLDISNLFPYTPYNSFIFPTKMKELLRSKFMMSLFCEWSETEQKYITESYADILTAICDAFGLQVQEYRNTLVFLTTDENTVTDSSAYVTFTATALHGYIDDIGDASSARIWEAQNPTFITTQQTISIHKGAKKVKVSADAGRLGNPVVDLLDDKYFKLISKNAYIHKSRDITQDWNNAHPNDDRMQSVKESYDAAIVTPSNGMRTYQQMGWTWDNPTQSYIPNIVSNQTIAGQKINFFIEGQNPQNQDLGVAGHPIYGSTNNPGAYLYKERQTIRGRKESYLPYETLEGDSDYTNRIVICHRYVNSSDVVLSRDCLVLSTGIFIEPIKGATDKILIFVNGKTAKAANWYDTFKEAYWKADMKLYIGNNEYNFNVADYGGQDVDGEIYGLQDKFEEFRNTGGYFQYPDKDVNPNIRGELKIVLYIDGMCRTQPNSFQGWNSLESLTVSIVNKNAVTKTGFDYTPTLSKELNNGFNNSISKSLKFMNTGNGYHDLCHGLLYDKDNAVLATAYDNKTLQKALFDRIVEYYKVARSELRTTFSAGRMMDPTKYIAYSGIKYLPTAQTIDYAADQIKTYLNETRQI